MDVNLDQLAKDISTMAITAVVNEWKAQGHNLSGKAISEIETVTKFQINELRITGLVLDYMAINNSGVTANRIPYTPNSGRPPSKYIQGLIQYAKRRMGASDKEAKSIAFAIASKHKKEGMPTRASSKYSSTGKRTEFLETALAKVEPDLLKLIERSIIYSIELTIMNFYKSILNR
jgi:hypothetical protein